MVRADFRFIEQMNCNLEEVERPQRETRAQRRASFDFVCRPLSWLNFMFLDCLVREQRIRPELYCTIPDLARDKKEH